MFNVESFIIYFPVECFQLILSRRYRLYTNGPPTIPKNYYHDRRMYKHISLDQVIGRHTMKDKTKVLFEPVCKVALLLISNLTLIVYVINVYV